MLRGISTTVFIRPDALRSCSTIRGALFAYACLEVFSSLDYPHRSAGSVLLAYSGGR